MAHFADSLLAAIETKRSHVVVGLDPDYALLPPVLRDKHEALDYDDDIQRRVGAYREFLFRLLIDLEPEAVAVKPQLAFYEALGARGFRLYEELVRAAHSRAIWSSPMPSAATSAAARRPTPPPTSTWRVPTPSP